jgi:CIC family chloride channel protein
MAAVFAAAAQAPMSSIFIVFEMTNDFGLIMPLMLSCAAATVVYTAITRDSIYEVKLRRKAALSNPEFNEDLMQTVPLLRAAEAKYVASIENRTIAQALEIMERAREELILIISHDRALRGVLFREDALEALEADSEASLASALRPNHPVGLPDDTLEEGMQKLEDANTDLLPMVDWNNRVLGVANRFAIVRAYETERDKVAEM